MNSTMFFFFFFENLVCISVATLEGAPLLLVFFCEDEPKPLGLGHLEKYEKDTVVGVAEPKKKGII